MNIGAENVWEEVVFVVEGNGTNWIITPYLNGNIGTPNTSTYWALNDSKDRYTFYVGNKVEVSKGW